MTPVRVRREINVCPAEKPLSIIKQRVKKKHHYFGYLVDSFYKNLGQVCYWLLWAKKANIFPVDNE